MRGAAIGQRRPAEVAAQTTIAIILAAVDPSIFGENICGGHLWSVVTHIKFLGSDPEKAVFVPLKNGHQFVRRQTCFTCDEPERLGRYFTDYDTEITTRYRISGETNASARRVHQRQTTELKRHVIQAQVRDRALNISVPQSGHRGDEVPATFGPVKSHLRVITKGQRRPPLPLPLPLPPRPPPRIS